MEHEKKKIEVTSAPSSNRPWFEHFNNIFFGIAKISGIPNAKNQVV
jgi:hypothetical protein